MPCSLSVATVVEIVVASVALLRPMLVGVSLSGVAGDTRPWMVLETRAETVTRLRSGEADEVCRLAVELSEERELVGVRCGFVPFSNTPGGVFMEAVLVSAPFTVAPGDVADREGDLGVCDADDVEAPGCPGGRGARYLTLAACD